MKKTTKEFIEESKLINSHKDYDYSKVEYKNDKTKVCIICPRHGEFWQTPHGHLQGQGCPKCVRKEWNTDRFIEEANKVHNREYTYEKTKFSKLKNKVIITCLVHGDFSQRADAHLNGQGCPLCRDEKLSIDRRNSNETFKNNARKIHDYKYDYSKVEYKNNKTKVCIICPKHGEFWQTPDTHLCGKGCFKCGQVMSKAENEIVDLLKPLECYQWNREILNGKEIDIYIPSLKIGIEYNGLFWHTEESGKNRTYHISKMNECNNQGISLIQIFEDEWVNHRKICESKLKQICGLNNNTKIYARKCNIKEINKQEAYNFLQTNHIQGKTGFTLGIGAYYCDKLVGVMTFKKGKYESWELNRFATDIDYQCIGIGGKLFKYFTKNYHFKEIKSFADRRWTIDENDNLYTKLGFNFDSYVRPSYWYYNQTIDRYGRFHKFSFRKQILNRKYGLPLEMSEIEMTKKLGYTRIWDCGLIKFVYKP